MKIIVIGIGRMGLGLAQHLIKAGHEVTAVDWDQEALDSLGSHFAGRKIRGTGLGQEVLEMAKIQKADGLVSCTKSDEVNAVIARVGKNIYHVPKVIARLYDPQKAAIYHRLGIETISSIEWEIQRAGELLTHNQMDHVYVLGNGEVNLIQIEVPPLLVGRSVNEVTVIGEVGVVSISRKNQTFIPTLGTTFQEEDILYITVSSMGKSKVKSIFGLL